MTTPKRRQVLRAIGKQLSNSDLTIDEINHVIGAEIEKLQRGTFGDFEHEVNCGNRCVIVRL